MIRSWISLGFASVFICMGSSAAFGMREAQCIITSSSDHSIKASFEVECPQTLEEKEKGLMFRKSLPLTHGMLFEYNPPAVVKFWMKNTEISLDILFVDEEGKVISIYKNRQPFDLTSFGPTVEIQAVLEIPAGSVENHNIKVGDLVSYDKFK